MAGSIRAGANSPAEPVRLGQTLRRGSQALRVLVVEDDAMIALELSCIVTERGGTVVAQTSVPLEAIGLAARVEPDVILMDVRLFGSMDGIDAAAQINRYRRTATVFVTGNGDPYTLSRLALSGAQVVLKPFAPEQIEAAILAAVHRPRDGF
jgi:CheY-like chemotaxis protein